ncbi:IgG-binding virulence factor TspB family protein [Neisseria gonorrhoeae]|nr:IgG-binding virulence factor TspB family protein [Neisseria gonorrhoeae]UXY78840.1 IgG-binding virulence factor TspB family protein [Neisseria gonorrhoeae]
MRHKGGSYVGTALLAHDVYQTFKEDIKARGCRYDPKPTNL